MNIADDDLPSLHIRLGSASWKSSGKKNAAVAEVVAHSESSSGAAPQRFSLGINDSPYSLRLQPGSYTVRVFLPNGDVMAESVSVAERENKEVGFDLRGARNPELTTEAVLGMVQRLPSAERARSLHAYGENLLKQSQQRGPSGSSDAMMTKPGPDDAGTTADHLVRLGRALFDVQSSAASIERISGHEQMARFEGWCWIGAAEPARAFPTRRSRTDRIAGQGLQRIYQPDDIAAWWMGKPEAAPVALTVTIVDERSARLTLAQPFQGDFAFGARRCYACVRDPTGAWHFCVLPQGWVRVTDEAGTLAEASILMTVGVDAVMRSDSEGSEPARWRCTPLVDDVGFNVYLGFLYNGQAQVADVLLQQAESFLFEKTINPIAAAAGAYGLLTYTPEENTRTRPAWRHWIHNLHQMAPGLPDGAIAMAQMYLRYGPAQPDGDDDIDVEVLRAYALEAVRRGLPCLTLGLTLLSDILQMLVRDDKSSERSGTLVEQTVCASAQVQQLCRLNTAGEFFTVIRFEGKPNG